ncbi:S-layer homology domain-containing protein [Candidatus Peregrinibacteria bacterium]|nr:S-layer homology domain-containing protein [Candidatus Peregrinibacteria bacterium]
MKSSFLKKWACLLSIVSLLVSLTAPAVFAKENRGAQNALRAPLPPREMSDDESTKMILKYPPRILFLQWGAILDKQEPATGTVNVTDTANVTDWSGYVEVSKGALKIVKKVRFESNDTASVAKLEDGRPGRVAWTSTISGGQDGLVLLFGAPNDATFTISTPYLGVQTFSVTDLVKGYHQKGIDVNQDSVADDYDFKAIVQSPFASKNQLFQHPELLEITVGCFAKDKNTCLGFDNSRTYSMTVSISGQGVELIAKPLRMEKNTDSIVSEKSGQVITSEFVVGPFSDGITARVQKTENFDEEDISESRAITVTVKEGEAVVFEKTFAKGDEFGQFPLSNNSGHSFMILNRLKGIQGLEQSEQDKYLAMKENFSTKLARLSENVDALLRNGTITSDTAVSFTNFIDELRNYNWDETVAGDVDNMLKNLHALLKNSRVKFAAFQSGLEEGKKQQSELRVRAQSAKYQKKLIPFRDVDDSAWFISDVQTMADKNIVSGYSDSSGKSLGEFRPANTVTKAEVLKMVLNTLGKEIRTSGAIQHTKAESHWAKDYVRTAEGLGLTLVSDSNVDLDSAVSRGDVIRSIFESMGVTPPAVSKTRFSDVTSANNNASYIEYAAELGVISGDGDVNGNLTGTFRPNDSLNRAEVSKILNNVMALTGTPM